MVNPEFESTNMVYSLWCARQHFEGGFVLSYGDIVYRPEVLDAVLAGHGPVDVAVDLAWAGYWGQRFADPLSDAETMRLTRDGRIESLGQRPRSLGEIQGQYIGLSRFSADASGH